MKEKKKSVYGMAGNKPCKLLFIAVLISVVCFLCPGASADISSSRKATLSKETQIKLLTLEEARVSLQTAIDMYEDRESELKDMKEKLLQRREADG